MILEAHCGKIIYDIGANNGDNIPYYLKKAEIVVAIEADPVLCEQIRERFNEDIKKKRLVIENCVVTADEEGASVPFYISKEHHVLSQFPVPTYNPKAFEKVILPAKSITQLIRNHGTPYYVKVDIEYYDHVLIRALFENEIQPEYISAESHYFEVFCLLVGLGGYNSFKIVDGRSVSELYNNWQIKTVSGIERYSFPHHSAGLFGDDVAGEWINEGCLFRRLLSEGLGWKDIHAKRQQSNPMRFTHIYLRAKYWYYKLKWGNATRPYVGRVLGRISRRN